MQNLQRLAALGITLRHSGHLRVAASSVSLLRLKRSVKWLIGLTTKKKTTAATIKKLIKAFMKLPYLKIASPTVK